MNEFLTLAFLIFAANLILKNRSDEECSHDSSIRTKTIIFLVLKWIFSNLL